MELRRLWLGLIICMYSAKSSFQHYTFGSVLYISVYSSTKQWRQVPFKLPRSLNLLYLKDLCFRSAFTIAQQNSQIHCTSEPVTTQSFLERGLGGLVITVSELWNVKRCFRFWLLANLCLLSCAPACCPPASASQQIYPVQDCSWWMNWLFSLFSFSYYN